MFLCVLKLYAHVRGVCVHVHALYVEPRGDFIARAVSTHHKLRRRATPQSRDKTTDAWLNIQTTYDARPLIKTSSDVTIKTSDTR